MKWLRYRHCQAAGKGDWTYKPLYTTRVSKKEYDYIKEDMDDLAHEYWHLDKFRGIEWEIINTKQVPNKHIEAAYNKVKSSIPAYKNKIKKAKERILTLELIKGQGRKTCPDEIKHEKRRKLLEKIKKENLKEAAKRKKEK